MRIVQVPPVLLLLMVGCEAKLRIDGSTHDEMEQSLAEIEAALSKEDWAEFQHGVTEVRSEIRQRPKHADQQLNMTYEVRIRLDGMTAQQVIELGRRKEKERREKYREMFPDRGF